MKKCSVFCLAIFLILSSVLPALAFSDYYTSDKFTIFPPKGFKKAEIEGTDFGYTVQTESGETVFFMLFETDYPGISPYDAISNADYFLFVDDIFKKGDFIEIKHYPYIDRIPVFYSLYKTEKNILAVSAFPGYDCILSIVAMSPLNYDPSAEVEALIQKIFPQ